MRFESRAFLFEFLPALLAAFFLARGVAALLRSQAATVITLSVVVLTAGSVWAIALTPVPWLLFGMLASTLLLTTLVHRSLGTPRARQLVLLNGAIIVLTFAAARWKIDGREFAFVGATVLCCHALAFVIDVYRREAALGDPLTSALYLTQFPVLPAGPIVRARDFRQHHLRLIDFVSLGGFTYGMRRVIIGVVKIRMVGGTLGVPVDAIFALPAARLGPGTAWLAAVCHALELYFVWSGYADIAIGAGRMFGLRYPENFRRPYVADSIREFWRRWNVTAITWLRDYLSLPIAGRDEPTARLFVNIVIGFCLLGLWHGGGVTVALWAVYSGGWLALEALGLGSRMERLHPAVRHGYVLVVVLVGWTLLRADTLPQAWTFMKALAGAGGPAAVSAGRYITWSLLTALVVAVVGAGPLVPWISRWRVTLDAGTAAIVMMITALSLFVWRPFVQLGEMVRLQRRKTP